LSADNIHIVLHPFLSTDEVGKLLKAQLSKQRIAVNIPDQQVTGELKIGDDFNLEILESAMFSQTVVHFNLLKQISFLKPNITGALRLKLKHNIEFIDDTLNVRTETVNYTWIDAPKADLNVLRFSVRSLVERVLQDQLPLMLQMVDNKIMLHFESSMSNIKAFEFKILEIIKSKLPDNTLKLDANKLQTSLRNIQLVSGGMKLCIQINYPEPISIDLKLSNDAFRNVL
jgi:hypothetical protein